MKIYRRQLQKIFHTENWSENVLFSFIWGVVLIYIIIFKHIYSSDA